jgi:HTH-type transcriptional regulator, glycine betaine synthesis regulator
MATRSPIAAGVRAASSAALSNRAFADEVLNDAASNLSEEPVSAGVATGDTFPALDEFERRIIESFVAVASLLGLPKSLGELYGLAYASTRPIHFSEACARLQLSKGAASQGLRTLRELGALKAVYAAGDRRDYFTPEVELRKFIARVLAERFQPHLERGADRLAALAEEIPAVADADTRRLRTERLQKLRRWYKKSAGLVPLLTKFLS